MSSVKKTMINIIKKQPDDSSYDEILQELSFINMVNHGMEDSKKNRVTEHEKLKKDIKKW